MTFEELKNELGWLFWDDIRYNGKIEDDIDEYYIMNDPFQYILVKDGIVIEACQEITEIYL